MCRWFKSSRNHQEWTVRRPIGVDLFYHDCGFQHLASKSRIIAEYIKLIINNSKFFLVAHANMSLQTTRNSLLSEAKHPLSQASIDLVVG